jgi:hypothetical protein
VTQDPQLLQYQLRETQKILRAEGLQKNADEGLYIVLLNDRGASALKKIGAEIFPTPDDDNYIYRTSDIGSLKGRQLTVRRSRIRSFERKNGILYSRELDEARSPAAREVIRKWHEAKLKAIAGGEPISPDHLRLLRDDFHSAMLSLKYLRQLPIQGQVYYLKEEPVGFISGVPLHQDTFLGLSFKSERIRGLADVIFSTFARLLSSKYAYLNTGQDLDVPSLRTFKKEWSPCRMLKTYRAIVPANLL